METKKVKEGGVALCIPQTKQIYKAPVFYNPEMVINRDISVLICKILKPKTALDLLAATGVRGLRLAKEAKIRDVYINDANPAAAKLMKKNAKLNRLKVKIFNLRAHELLATRYSIVPETKFDYIDVDPFGTPMPFLDATVKALTDGGVIGVTATDTAALCGSAPTVCIRRYGAKPLRNYLMHEIGIRILLKKIVEIGAQYDMALTPIFCHATQHYMRIYLKSERGAEKADEILKQIGFYQGAGPMWLGRLWDEKLTDKLLDLARLSTAKVSAATANLLYVLAEESKIPVFGFFDLAEFKLKQVPKISKVIEKLQEDGYKAARTHFSSTGVRTDADIKPAEP